MGTLHNTHIDNLYMCFTTCMSQSSVWQELFLFCFSRETQAVYKIIVNKIEVLSKKKFEIE